ncbi:MAG: hypothetical protein AAFO02_00520 [Bacteroidota bacterium]
MPIPDLYYVKSDYCGTWVDTIPRSGEKAQSLADELNQEAIELEHPEVTYSITKK